MSEHETDVAIVGGGLAGLSAAALLARAGRKVTVFEKANLLGGRALTSEERGFHLNLGPHALYKLGAANRLLGELGVKYSGALPTASGAYALRGGKKFALPGGPVSLITTGLFGLSAKLETAKLLASIARVKTDSLHAVSAADWLAGSVRHAEVRGLVEALFRVATYANDPRRMSAGAALQQVRLALLGNVYYLDRGWQTLVDGLRGVAEKAGAQIVRNARAVAVARESAVHGVRLADGRYCAASAVILTVPPEAVAPLVGLPAEHPLARFAEAAIPVRAACLDVALERLPRPAAKFALGIDSPLYVSVHSATAKLAPEGKAMIHVAKYMGDEDAEPRRTEKELEDALELLQPGWRDAVAYRRFLPNMIVSHALPTAAMNGTAGRPSPRVAGIGGLYVAGDWVGAEGLLADASAASARAAAEMILAERSAARQAA